jgi:hypothetical protein
MHRIVALLTDYGEKDQYAGSLRGAVLSACPEARVVDITHDIGRHNVREAGFVLRATAPAFPAGTVFVAVVDPGVGGPRRGIAIRAGGNFFVGPDNGVFTLILADHRDAEVRELTNRALFRHTVSSTFHGRDIFGPVGGALARGNLFEEVGVPIHDPEVYEFPAPELIDGQSAIEGRIIHIDRFGNLITSIGGPTWQTFIHGAQGDLTEMVAHVNRVVLPVVNTFGDVPEDDACAYPGSAGRIEIAVNRGSAQERFQLKLGDRVRLKRVAVDPGA